MTELKSEQPFSAMQWLQCIREEEEQQRKKQEEVWRRQQEEWEQNRLRREKQRRREQILEDSVGIFLEERPGFTFDLSSGISSQELYRIYCTWCRSERVIPEGLRALSWRLKRNIQCYPVRETILTRNGRRCRGFLGIRAVTDDTDKSCVSSG